MSSSIGASSSAFFSQLPSKSTFLRRATWPTSLSLSSSSLPRGSKRADSLPASTPPATCGCRGCGRRAILLGSPLIAANPSGNADAAPDPPGSGDRKFVRAPRPEWFEKLYAWVMYRWMRSYEKEVEKYKEKLFKSLNGENKKILEIGLGTGPNLKYYGNTVGINVYGVDPNKQMEKYAKEAATISGLPLTNFKFLQGVAESLPVEDGSMDVVVGTLVLCSVNNLDVVLQEVKRVLKNGGVYIFIEHVAAQDGSLLKLVQTILDPLQQFVGDGCHLTRETGRYISGAGFSDVKINTTVIKSASILGPHVYGIACK